MLDLFIVKDILFDFTCVLHCIYPLPQTMKILSFVQLFPHNQFIISSIVEINQQQLTMTTKIDELLLCLPPLFPPNTLPTPILFHHPPILPPPSPTSIHKMKLDVPRFDGTDPSGWIFKINQFFEYHGTPAHKRLTIASFYMEGRALSWFQWMTDNDQFTSWPVFLHT